jgi:N-sulfoglucosamine sulfohydrolase
MRFRVVLLLLGLVSVSFAEERPNILWIIADDLGMDLGCHGTVAVQTPNLDQLAEQGVQFDRAYSTGPVCSVSRSSLITGMYPTTIRCQPHRKVSKLPLPDGIKPITEYFRAAGYYVCNGNYKFTRRGKTDYNFTPTIQPMYDGIDWKERGDGQPFFAQVQIFDPHRPFVKENSPERRAKVEFPPYYPDHPVTRADWANYLASVEVLDQKAGAILQRLEDEGLAENTVVFFFGDHGRPHVRDKQWLYDGGLHTPLIVRGSKMMKAGSIDQRMVSLIDISAASIAIAGIPIPENVQGLDMLSSSFIGREAVYASAGRAGGKMDRIRSVQVGNLRYIRNFTEGESYMFGPQESAYKSLEYPVHSLLKLLHAAGKLTPEQELFMVESRPGEELYDIAKDPFELNNLAANPEYAATLAGLRERLTEWMDECGDTEGAQELAPDVDKAIESNKRWYRSKLKKQGMTPETSDHERVAWWADTLNVKMEM